jgi:3-oxoacyl-[acyl-carrier protein] reductase
MNESKVMLLTGCAAGIGRRLAVTLARRGHRLLVTDVDEAGLDDLVQRELGDCNDVARESFDVRDSDAWQRSVAGLVARWGRIDVLLNVAGTIHAGWAHDMQPDQVHRLIDVNVKGVVFGTNAAARQMIQQGAGQIVNIASMAGIASVPGIAVYSASKHAVRGFSLAVAEELRPHGVSVSVVCPGLVDTAMLDAQVGRDEAAFTFIGARVLEAGDVVDAIVEGVLRQTPLERTVTLKGSGQAPLAKLLNAIPELQRWVAPIARRLGLRNQQRFRERR